MCIDVIESVSICVQCQFTYDGIRVCLKSHCWCWVSVTAFVERDEFASWAAATLAVRGDEPVWEAAGPAGSGQAMDVVAAEGDPDHRW